MFAKWINRKRWILAIGVAVISWGTLQSEGIASGEFVLTDRIGEGSVLHVTREILPEHDGKVLYFQDGKPMNLTQVHVEHPYCKFQSTSANLGQHFSKNHNMVVRFKNVARARWFFDQGVELECIGPHARDSIRESDFNRVLGRYFEVEKHTSAHFI